jgi:hypothetical protein
VRRAPVPNQPRYRLTYRKIGEYVVTVEFDIAPAGKPDAFANYVRGSMRRKQGQSSIRRTGSAARRPANSISAELTADSGRQKMTGWPAWLEL